MSKSHEPTDAGQTDDETLGRRALLRRAGTIAAIAGGAAVIQATGTGSAEAATGGNVVMGAANTADATSTSLTSSAATAVTLAVANSGTTHAPLALTKSADGIFTSATAVAGELFVGDVNSNLWYVNAVTAPQAALVFTEETANQVVGITPHRVLDTRNSAGRVNIITGSTHVGSGGLAALQWIQVDLSGVAGPIESVFANLTAVTPSGSGYLTVADHALPAGSSPGTSSLSFTKGVTLANGVVAATDRSDFDSIWIYARTTTHILLDVTAVNVPSTDFVNPAVLPAVVVGHAQASRRAAFAAAVRARRLG